MAYWTPLGGASLARAEVVKRLRSKERGARSCRWWRWNFLSLEMGAGAGPRRRTGVSGEW